MCFLRLLLIVCMTAGHCYAGQLLVSDRATHQITKYDAQTGEFLEVLVDGDLEKNGGLIAPASMTLGPQGDLFVASFSSLRPDGLGSVLRYDIDSGDFLGTFADELPGPSGLFFDVEQDEMYVSTLGNFDSELIYRYRASTGELLSTFGAGTGISGRTAIDLGPDGNLYVGSFANGEFFTGAILAFDRETQSPLGSFALEPFLSGANDFTFRPGDQEHTYQLDLVGLFSNNVARFDVAQDDSGMLSVVGQEVLIAAGLDFPSALMDLGDGSMLITNLGNDNPATGDLRPGSIARFDVASGEFVDTFIAAGGEGNLAQPTALILLPATYDCNADGIVDSSDLSCACGADVDGLLAELNLIPGDLDASGEVDFADFLVLSESFGTVADFSNGDLDCDGQVTFADFLVLSANFGLRSSTQSVPEPCGHWLALCACLAVVLRGPRRT